MVKIWQIQLPRFHGNYPKSSIEQKRERIKLIKNEWIKYAQSRRSLLDTGIFKTQRLPEAEFSEWLVSILNDGIPNRKHNEVGYDLECVDKRIEVKSISRTNSGSISYSIKENDIFNENATHYVFVVFEDFMPKMIYEIEVTKMRNYYKKYLTISDFLKIGKRIDNDFLFDLES